MDQIREHNDAQAAFDTAKRSLERLLTVVAGGPQNSINLETWEITEAGGVLLRAPEEE
jgi:hypothetical protein